jgi:hypothetical protein
MAAVHSAAGTTRERVDIQGEVKGRHMARALMGYVGSPGDQVLAFEVARLRRRVEELEAEVARLREHSRAELELELHRIAEVAEPALA